MKCYNNFNDMFNAQVNNGARMNVFNGVAETSGLKDLVNGYDLPYVVRVITGLSGDFAVAVKDDDGGKFVLKDKIDSSSPIHEDLKYAGIDNIIDTLNTAIDKARKAGKSIDTGRWSDKLLQDNLNKCAKNYGYSYTWDNVGTGKVDMKAKKDAEARAEKEKKDTEAKKTAGEKPVITPGVRATGAYAIIEKANPKKGTPETITPVFLKFEFNKAGEPVLTRFDEHYKKVGTMKLDKVFSSDLLDYFRTEKESVEKIKNDEWADMLEYSVNGMGLNPNLAMWVGGDESLSKVESKYSAMLPGLRTKEQRDKSREEADEMTKKKEQFDESGLLGKALHTVDALGSGVSKFLFGK